MLPFDDIGIVSCLEVMSELQYIFCIGALFDMLRLSWLILSGMFYFMRVQLKEDNGENCRMAWTH
jgi:hypothetical protein